jgi:chromosome segregation ATPase
MENGDETFASPLAGSAAEFEFDPSGINGGGRATKLHDADEIDALRAAKRDLEEKLDAVGHQNRFLSAESARLEVLVAQAREEVATAESTAAANEGEVATLRAEVKRLQDLLDAEKSAREVEKRKGAGLGDKLQSAYQEKAALEQEIEALKASVAAAEEKDKGEEGKDSAAPSAVAPKEMGAPSHGLVAAAAAGAAATAAIAVVLLNLKR